MILSFKTDLPYDQLSTIESNTISVHFKLVHSSSCFYSFSDSNSFTYSSQFCLIIGYCLYKKSDGFLISLGDILLRKENYKNQSCCFQDEYRFDYHGIENALCGKDWTFTPKRILVIQMK